MHRFLAATLILPALLSTAVFADTPAKAVDFWNGKDLTGWEFVTSPTADIKTVCTVTTDGVLAVIGKPTGYIQTTASYENYRLHVEWRWSAKPGNSGVLVHISPGPVDRIWPTCFQIQTKNTRVGDLLPMAAGKFAETLSTAPGAKTPQLDRQKPDSEKPAGEWNACDIICRGDEIECTINGVFQNRVTKCLPASGKIGIQLEGTPYELRNIRIEPLKRAIGSSPQLDNF